MTHAGTNADYEFATVEEMAPYIGTKWVIARRTPRIVRKYGADVNCISHRKYLEASRKALEDRRLKASF
jgi:hypothetical protein